MCKIVYTHYIQKFFIFFIFLENNTLFTYFFFIYCLLLSAY